MDPRKGAGSRREHRYQQVAECHVAFAKSCSQHSISMFLCTEEAQTLQCGSSWAQLGPHNKIMALIFIFLMTTPQSHNVLFAMSQLRTAHCLFNTSLVQAGVSWCVSYPQPLIQPSPALTSFHQQREDAACTGSSRLQSWTWMILTYTRRLIIFRASLPGSYTTATLSIVNLYHSFSVSICTVQRIGSALSEAQRQEKLAEARSVINKMSTFYMLLQPWEYTEPHSGKRLGWVSEG